MVPSPDGPTHDSPSLSTYLETRLNLLTEQIKDSAAAQASALGSSIEAMKQALTAADLRYQQRFAAQGEALQAAFLSQQVAMKTALEAAKEAVNAALAAADRAVLKAELAADKRFEALNELRQMLNDTMKILMTRTEVHQMVGAVAEKGEALSKRVDGIEGRLNLQAGEASGNRRTKDDTRAYVAVGISLVLVALAIATFFIARMNTP